jgi:tetratricopeptide (TPR) repeat protein
MSSDEHLDVALEEYNDKVSRLETEGPVSELLEALINRGTILLMMESTISALSDFDDAIDIIEDEEREGRRIDAGLYIRAHEGRGNLLFDGDQIGMLEDYRKVAARLPELMPGNGYFDVKGIVEMCIDVADDLMNTGKFHDAEPFLHKALDVLEGRIGDWEDNRRADAYSYLGNVYERTGQPQKAIENYGKDIDIDRYLADHHLIDDYRRLVMSLYNRAELRNDAGDSDGYLSDFILAAEYLEITIESGQSDEKELLVGMCQAIASLLVEKGKVADSEKYLIKAMKYGMPDIDRAMSQLGIRKPSE